MASTDSGAARPVDDLAGVDVVFALLTDAVATMTEGEARRASRLPGWTRGHVLTHLARNADGQRRMVEGVLRDEVLDQYPGGDEQRARDIEAGADRPVAELLTDLDDSQRALVGAWSQVADGTWDRLTRARAATRPGATGSCRGGVRSPSIWWTSTSVSRRISFPPTTSSATRNGSVCTDRLGF